MYTLYEAVGMNDPVICGAAKLLNITGAAPVAAYVGAEVKALVVMDAKDAE